MLFSTNWVFLYFILFSLSLFWFLYFKSRAMQREGGLRFSFFIFCCWTKILQVIFVVWHIKVSAAVEIASTKTKGFSLNVNWIRRDRRRRGARRRCRRCRRRRRRRSIVGQRKRMTSIVEETSKSELVKSVRIFLFVVLRVRVVVQQPCRIDRIEVRRVGLVKDLGFPRRLLQTDRFGEVDSVEEGMSFDLLGSVNSAESRRRIGAKSSDQIFGLEWNDAFRNMKSLAPTDDL